MVLPLAILSAYLVFSVLVGLCGSQRRLGFTGTFLLSLVITPILALVIILITGPSRRVRLERSQSRWRLERRRSL
jgi:ABC-type multidrug transport system permease subunit